MKKFIVCFILLIGSLASYAQNCQIALYSGDPKGHGDSKPIPFTIEVKDTLLRSSPDGVVIIEKKYFDKVKGSQVISFKFFNQLDLEYFRTPMFTRTQRTLQEYCGQILIAEKRW